MKRLAGVNRLKPIRPHTNSFMKKMTHYNFFASAARFAMVAVGLAFLAGCADGLTRSGAFTRDPVSWKVASREIDEDTSEHTIIFRNFGQQVLSFDYTVADESGVPHVDADGPNSGLIENLYPGAQVEVKNPWKRSRVAISVGKVTRDKKSTEALAAIYRPGAAAEGGKSAPAR
jgi:hypothetical protein